jgi:hypothetical protein
LSTAPHAPPWTHLTLWARLRTQERRLSSLHLRGGLRVSGAIDPFDHTRHVWAINSGWGPPPAHADAAPGVVDAVLQAYPINESPPALASTERAAAESAVAAAAAKGGS